MAGLPKRTFQAGQEMLDSVINQFTPDFKDNPEFDALVAKRGKVLIAK